MPAPVPSAESRPESKAERFRDRRIAALREYYLLPSPYLLHLVPVAPPPDPVDLASFQQTLNRRIPPPVWGRGFLNPEGYLIAEQLHGVRQAHVQYFHDGSVELYVGGTAQDYPTLGRRVIWGDDIENQAVVQVETLLPLLARLGVPLPLAVCLSLLDVSGAALVPARPDRFRADRQGGIAQDDLLLPPVVLASFDVDVPAALRPAFDVLWQATGWPQSPTYSSDGHWSGNRRV